MTASDPIVAYVTFRDGQRRPVFEDDVGQYVLLDEGEPVRGAWVLPRDLADEPVIVEEPRKPSELSLCGPLLAPTGFSGFQRP